MEKKWSFMGSIQAFGASLGFGEAPEETPAVVKEGDIDRTYTIRGGGQGGYLGEALRDRKNVEKFVDQIIRRSRCRPRRRTSSRCLQPRESPPGRWRR